MTNLYDIFIMILKIITPAMTILTVVGIGLYVKCEHECRVLNSEYRMMLKELLQLEREMDEIRFRQEDPPRELLEIETNIIELPDIQHVEPKDEEDVLHIPRVKITKEKEIEVPKTREEFETSLKSMCNYIGGRYLIDKNTLATNMHECNIVSSRRIFIDQYTLISGKPYLTATGIRYIEELPIVESLKNDIVANTLHIVFRRHYVIESSPNIIPVRIDKYKDQVKTYKESQVI